MKVISIRQLAGGIEMKKMTCHQPKQNETKLCLFRKQSINPEGIHLPSHCDFLYMTQTALVRSHTSRESQKEKERDAQRVFCSFLHVVTLTLDL